MILRARRGRARLERVVPLDEPGLRPGKKHPGPRRGWAGWARSGSWWRRRPQKSGSLRSWSRTTQNNIAIALPQGGDMTTVAVLAIIAIAVLNWGAWAHIEEE